jgi:hypothetical protein
VEKGGREDVVEEIEERDKGYAGITKAGIAEKTCLGRSWGKEASSQLSWMHFLLRSPPATALHT